MLIKDLPQKIREIAEMRLKEQGGDLKKYKEIDGLQKWFAWYRTTEGEDIWREVNNGNFKPFYDFHKTTPETKKEWMPVMGELVEMSDEGIIWVKRIFAVEYKGKYYTESNLDEDLIPYNHIRKIEAIEISMDEAITDIAKLRNVSPDKIKIV